VFIRIKKATEFTLKVAFVPPCQANLFDILLAAHPLTLYSLTDPSYVFRKTCGHSNKGRVKNNSLLKKM